MPSSYQRVLSQHLFYQHFPIFHVSLPVKWNIFGSTLYQEISLFQMQISEPRWNKASYLEAISYFLPSKGWGAGGGAWGSATLVIFYSKQQIEWVKVTQSISDSWQLHRLQPTMLLGPWNSPGNNTGVSCHSLPQGIFLTRGLNLWLLHCRQILYRWAIWMKGKPNELRSE